MPPQLLKQRMGYWLPGSGELTKKHPDVSIYTSENRGGIWGSPALVADGIANDTLRYPCWNPVLFKKDNGDIVLYYKVGPQSPGMVGVYIKFQAMRENHGQKEFRYPTIS